MSREFKFRAWSKYTNKMIYPSATGWYEKAFMGENGHLQTADVALLFNRDDVVVMQYAGLPDKDGTDVYENDYFVKLVKYINIDSGEQFSIKEHCPVVFYEGKFMVYQDGWGHFELKDVINQTHHGSDEWESGTVAGNTFEHPVLNNI